MKVNGAVLALILCICICGEVPANASDNNRWPRSLMFAQYYEPYEPNYEPNTPGYSLPLDINDIVNRDEFSFYNERISNLVRQNGFAVLESVRDNNNSRIDFVYVYEMLKNYGNTPAFVAADTGLYLYHTQFDQTLKEIEEDLFVADINDLTKVLLSDMLEKYDLLEGDLKEAAKRNVAYLSVAHSLIAPGAAVPGLVDGMVAGELAKIEAHAGFSSSDIFLYREDYSQYVPRGHYTRSEELKRYFKTMMWFGRMAFLLKGSQNWGPYGDALISEQNARIQTLQAFLLADSLRNIQLDDRAALDIWDRLYTVTAFYVGLADDLTPYDYLWALDQVFANDFVLEDLADETSLLNLKKELAFLPSPEIYGGTGNIMVPEPITDESLDEVLSKTKGMRLLGQRYLEWLGRK